MAENGLTLAQDLTRPLSWDQWQTRSRPFHRALKRLYPLGVPGREAAALAGINRDRLDPFIERLRRTDTLR